MEHIKEIIKENLLSIRKLKKITQIELAEKINYSDKAISRWETGEVTPDVETLNKLSEIYNVELTYFFVKHDDKNNINSNKKFHIANKLAITLLAMLSIWFLATLIYVYLQSLKDINAWIVFLWAVPLSSIVAIIFNAIWGKRIWRFILISILLWSLITVIYLQFLTYNLYLIFYLGIPLQIATILWACIKRTKVKKKP